ncbi:hypothetical protein MUK42_17938 [Musa troglodytarum]|uniref:Uncharacterized protein n=1 Tax=Musa troglodytarum TaxID=320322 RepID=A0A9E7KVU1_9LILI|nr:hypothetical protein MUK42_17938 [Musa troglodytarum]
MQEQGMAKEAKLWGGRFEDCLNELVSLEQDLFSEDVTRIYSENISCYFMTIESKQDSQSNPASVRWWCSWRFQEMIVGSLSTLSRGDSSTPPIMALQRARPPHLGVPREVIAHVENQMSSFHDTPAVLYKEPIS